MGVPSVILHLLIIPYCLHIVTCINAQNRTSPTAPLNGSNVAVEGGPIALPPTVATQNDHMMKVNHTKDANDTTHLGREHMIKVDHSQSENLPQYEQAQKNDNKTSVPKKSASTSSSTSSSTTSTTTTTTSTTPAPHKPTITIGEDEEPRSSNTGSKPHDTHNHGMSMEAVTEKTKKTDYVVPIVAVILSVPLVAIVFSVLYKRGADWWQHRHYRRMDFLIEGMYNN